MATTPIAKRPSDRIAEIIREGNSYFVANKFTNEQVNIFAVQKYLDEQWEEETSYIFEGTK